MIDPPSNAFGPPKFDGGFIGEHRKLFMVVGLAEEFRIASPVGYVWPGWIRKLMQGRLMSVRPTAHQLGNIRAVQVWTLMGMEDG